MLKRHRMAKGLSLRELARRIGVTTTACSNWETGKSKPRPRSVPKLASALDLNPMDLITLLTPAAVFAAR